MVSTNKKVKDATSSFFNHIVSFFKHLKEKSLSGALMNVYAAIGVPILEEIIFRGALHNYFNITAMDSKEKAKNNRRLEKIKTIVKSSLIFGAMHLSFSMGWTNIPVLIVITLMGGIFSIFKEATNDIWASTAMHSVNNTLACLQVHKII